MGYSQIGKRPSKTIEEGKRLKDETARKVRVVRYIRKNESPGFE
jgi:hypothetical protein